MFSFIGGPDVNAAINQLRRGGTHETLEGGVPARQEAEKLIALAGGSIVRIEKAHEGVGHQRDHINYPTSNGQKATVGTGLV